MNINTSNEVHRVLKKIEGEVEGKKKSFDVKIDEDIHIKSYNEALKDVLEIINNNKPI